MLLNRIFWLFLLKIACAQLNGQFWWTNENVIRYHKGLKPVKPISPAKYSSDAIIFEDSDLINRKGYHFDNHKNVDLPVHNNLKREDKSVRKEQKKDNIKELKPYETIQNEDKIFWPSGVITNNKISDNKVSSTITDNIVPTSVRPAKTHDSVIFELPKNDRSQNKITTPTELPVVSETPQVFKEVTSDYPRSNKSDENTESPSICSYIKEKECISKKGFIYSIEFGKSATKGPKNPKLICCILPLSEQNNKVKVTKPIFETKDTKTNLIESSTKPSETIINEKPQKVLSETNVDDLISKYGVNPSEIDNNSTTEKKETQDNNMCKYLKKSECQARNGFVYTAEFGKSFKRQSTNPELSCCVLPLATQSDNTTVSPLKEATSPISNTNNTSTSIQDKTKFKLHNLDYYIKTYGVNKTINKTDKVNDSAERNKTSPVDITIDNIITDPGKREKQAQYICTYLEEAVCHLQKGLVYEQKLESEKNRRPLNSKLICCILPLSKVNSSIISNDITFDASTNTSNVNPAPSKMVEDIFVFDVSKKQNYSIKYDVATAPTRHNSPTSSTFRPHIKEVTEKDKPESICTYIQKEECNNRNGFIYSTKFGKSSRQGPSDPNFVCCILPEIDVYVNVPLRGRESTFKNTETPPTSTVKHEDVEATLNFPEVFMFDYSTPRTSKKANVKLVNKMKEDHDHIHFDIISSSQNNDIENDVLPSVFVNLNNKLHNVIETDDPAAFDFDKAEKGQKLNKVNLPSIFFDTSDIPHKYPVPDAQPPVFFTTDTKPHKQRGYEGLPTMFFDPINYKLESPKKPKKVCTEYITVTDCLIREGRVIETVFHKPPGYLPDPNLICCSLPEKRVTFTDSSNMFFPDSLTQSRFKRSSNQKNTLKQRDVLMRRYSTESLNPVVSRVKISIPDYEYDEDPYWNIKNVKFQGTKPNVNKEQQYSASNVPSDYADELPQPGLKGLYSDPETIPWSFDEKPTYDDNEESDDEEMGFGYSTIDPRSSTRSDKREQFKVTEDSYEPEKQIVSFQSNPDFHVLEGFKLLNIIKNKRVHKVTSMDSDGNDNKSGESNDRDTDQLFDACGKTSMRNTNNRGKSGAVRYGSHPWIAIVVPTQHQQKILCYATLILPRAAVTTAGCVDGKSPDELTLIAGLWDLTQRSRAKTRRAVAHVHPRYKPGHTDDDLAILTWDLPLKIGANIQPACLADVEDAEDCVIVGWGRRGQAIQPRPKWQRVEIADCEQTSEEVLPSNAFCGSVQTQGIVTRVGGPLICNVNGRQAISGVTVSHENSLVFLPVHDWALKSNDFIEADYYD